MLELYQFEVSHYTEKVRLILDYKGLDYRKIEVKPGIGQIDIFRMSGQRQVPVLKDGKEIIADSTAIAKYLDTQYPERPIIPTDPQQKALCLMMEEWADEAFGLNARKAMLGAFSADPNLRTSALPSTVPDVLKRAVSAFPGEVLSMAGTPVGFGADAVHSARKALQEGISGLCVMLQDKPYLITDHPTLADFAVAGLSIYIKFPDGDYVATPITLQGKGVPDIADNPAYAPFFAWRDRIYTDYRKTLGNSSAGPSQNPTTIPIE